MSLFPAENDELFRDFAKDPDDAVAGRREWISRMAIAGYHAMEQNDACTLHVAPLPLPRPELIGITSVRTLVAGKMLL
jgi:hypothetical protein